MQHPVVIRVKKLQTMGNIAASAEHTWRERYTHNADPKRQHLNEDWRPANSSQALQAAVKARVDLVTDKPDAKRVPCLEYLITAHQDAFKECGGKVSWREYFKDGLEFLEARHGAANIVGVNVQLDEQAPHCVVYVVPLVEEAAKSVKRSVIVGKNADGSQRREVRDVEKKASVRLSAATFADGPAKLSQLQTDFAKFVGKRHGLVRGVKRSQATHTTVSEYYDALNSGLSHIVIKPAVLEPKVLKKGLIRNEVEEPEAIAKRLTIGVQKFYEPALQQAKTARLDRKKAVEATSTLQSLQGRYSAFFENIDGMLRCVSQKRVVEALDSVRTAFEAEWRAKQNEAVEMERIVNEAALNLSVAKGWEWNRAHAEASAWLDDPSRHQELLNWSTWLPPGEVKDEPDTVLERSHDEFDLRR